jgi:hypothetical protein
MVREESVLSSIWPNLLSTAFSNILLIIGSKLIGLYELASSSGKEYATIGEAVFSVIRAILVVTQRALNTLQ